MTDAYDDLDDNYAAMKARRFNNHINRQLLEDEKNLELAKAEFESFGSWLTDTCNGECSDCGLYQPHKHITCRGTEKMQELQKQLEGSL